MSPARHAPILLAALLATAACGCLASQSSASDEQTTDAGTPEQQCRHVAQPGGDDAPFSGQRVCTSGRMYAEPHPACVQTDKAPAQCGMPPGDARWETSSCSDDADCSGRGGHYSCLQDPPGAEVPGCHCGPRPCTTDDECDDGAACLCVLSRDALAEAGQAAGEDLGPALDLLNRWAVCRVAECRTGQDCATGLCRVTPTPRYDAVGDRLVTHLYGFFCTTADDECSQDGNCPEGQVCSYDLYHERWMCQTNPRGTDQ